MHLVQLFGLRVVGNIQMVGESQAPMFRGEKPTETKLAPQWTLERIARHAVDFWLSTEDLPDPENRVTVDRDGKLTLSYAETNATAKQRLYHKLKSMLSHLGMHSDHLFTKHAYMKNEVRVAGCAHQAGTCRFGADPSSSVLDANCKGARARQPVCGRHQLLSEHWRRQPGADRNGERTARRGSPARPDRAQPIH
jgi:GMC oxidoreductase